MKPSELNQILKEVVAEELTKEGYIGHPEWDAEHGDGYTNDAQRAFAHSQMTSPPRHNDTKKAQELAKQGKYVVLVKDDVHCKATDAVLGQCVSIHKVFDTIGEAEREADRLHNSGMDVDLVTPKSVGHKEDPRPTKGEDDDKIPFEEGKRICSWCKKDMGQASTEADTHGMCPECEKDFGAEIEKMAANPDPALMARQSKLEALKKRRDPDGIEEVNYTKTSSGQSVMAQGAPGSVVRFATENPEVMKQMRDWAKDCQWKEDPEEIDEMSDEDILRGVQRHYEGGIKAFIQDSQSKAEVPVGYKEGYGMGDMSKDPKKAFKKARWTVKFDENISTSELKSLIKEVINEELKENSNWNPQAKPQSPAEVAKLIFGLKEGEGIWFGYDQTGRSYTDYTDWVEKSSDGQDIIYYRGLAAKGEPRDNLETDEEVQAVANEIAANKHLQYYAIQSIPGYQKPRTRYDQSDDQQVGDYEKYGPDPVRWQDVTEETWPSPDDKLKQYEDVKEWERDNLDGLHKYKGEPLKNHGFPYQVGDIVPNGTYNRNNAMHLWNMAKKQRQQHLKLGPPAGFGWNDPKKLYEAKGANQKEKIRNLIKESVGAVLKEYSEQEEIKLINQIAAITRTAISRTSIMEPTESMRQFKDIDALAQKLVKMHSEKTGRNPETGIYDVPGTDPKTGIHNAPKEEQRSALGVTQETVSRTKKVLEQMLFQKRKK